MAAAGAGTGAAARGAAGAPKLKEDAGAAAEAAGAAEAPPKLTGAGAPGAGANGVKLNMTWASCGMTLPTLPWWYPGIVRPPGMVQVEAWTAATGIPQQSATVRVLK